MIQRHLRILKRIIQPCSFYSIIAENKSVPQIQRFSTKLEDESIINQIYQLKREEFKNISSNEWLDRINILRVHDIMDSDCLDMITRHPDILQIPLKNLEDSINQWSCSHVEKVAFQALIFKNPELLEVEDREIRKRQSHLLMLCGSVDLLTRLLMENPNVMFDKWNAVLEKINYLLEFHRFKMREVVESSALSRTLDFIKFRLDILEKCGIYIRQTAPVHKINKYDPSQHRNPTLKNILALNEEYFSFEVANITVEEYNVCYDLFMAEEYESFDEDEDLEDDSDHSKDENSKRRKK